MVKINIENLHGKDAAGSVKHGRTEKTGGSKNVSAAQAKPSLEQDKIEMSGKSAEFGKLIDQIKQLPDVRHERVVELKQKISSGEYDPSNEDIADAIIKDE